MTDAFTEADGTFALGTYQGFDGAPEGDYKVTVVLRDPFFEPSGKMGANRLPEKYATAAATELTAKVTTGRGPGPRHGVFGIRTVPVTALGAPGVVQR